MKQGIYLILLLFLLSCGNSGNQMEVQKITLEKEFKVDSILNSQNFNRAIKYEPISLMSNGKAFLSPGQKVESIDTAFSFSQDPNGRFWNNINLIKDHFSIDSDLSIKLKLGSINGIFFFSSDQIENQIFNISGNWLIETELTKDNEAEIIEQITEKLFPVLKNELCFEENWKYENKRENYVEYFSLNPPDENGLSWSLMYKVKNIMRKG